MSGEHKSQLAEAPVAEAWKRWLDKTVNAEFPLREHLGGSAHRAVFLTEYDHRPAAIHLISENCPDRTRQLESWQLAAEISHPNLTRVYRVGLCQIENEDLFYAVMEFAEENLGQILTQRALSTEETSEMLKPALDALAHLHKRGLAHGALNPANIWAMGDQLKLSCGDLCRTGEAIRVAGKYDPPEPLYSPAADVWSLGMTIAEVLTQSLPRWDRNGVADPQLPPDLAAPLLEAMRNCLHRDIQQRWTAQEVSDHLSGKIPTRAERAQPVVPAAGSAARERKKPDAKEASFARVAPAAAVRNRAPKKPRTLLYAVIFIIAASLMAIKLITRTPQPVSPAEGAQSAASNQAAAPTAQPPVQVQEGAVRNASAGAAAAATKEPGNVAPATKLPQAETAKPTSGVSRSVEGSVAAHAAQPSRGLDQEPAATGAIHQVMPDVLQSAQRTIRGTVRVAIKVHVDDSGNVTDALIDSPGPSKYFANAALQAARQWKFGPGAEAAGDWLVRFDFTADGAGGSAKPLEH